MLHIVEKADTVLPMKMRAGHQQAVQRNLLLHSTYKTVDSFLSLIAHLPGGYIWQRQLPLIGKKSLGTLRRKLVHIIIGELFTVELISAMLQAALGSTGQIDHRGIKLYNWLLKYIYHDDVRLLYQQWLQVKGDTT